MAQQTNYIFMPQIFDRHLLTPSKHLRTLAETCHLPTSHRKSAFPSADLIKYWQNMKHWQYASKQWFENNKFLEIYIFPAKSTKNATILQRLFFLQSTKDFHSNFAVTGAFLKRKLHFFIPTHQTPSVYTCTNNSW